MNFPLPLRVSSTKMSDFPCTIRNYCPDDFNNYIQLNVEAEQLDPTGRCTSPQVLRERLSRPNYAPEQDLFVAEEAGKVIGYIDVTPELSIGRAVLDCLVHPEHRRKGLATELFHCALRRATGLEARVAHVSILQNNVAAKNLLPKLGFGLVRHFLELRLQLSQAPFPDAPSALLCRHLQCGEEDKLTEIQNRSFAGTWGYNPNTLAEIIYRVNLNDCSPEDVILVCEEDKPVGYCWTINWEEDAYPGTSKGRIYMLGVDPDHRGKGIGRLLLLAGLAYLKNKGVEVAELTVDSQNRVACGLYESVGFKISSTTLWYEKVLD